MHPTGREEPTIEELHAEIARLRFDADRLKLALAAGAIIGTWFWDVPADRIIVDESFAEAFGLDPKLGREGISLQHIIETVHPDDQAGLEAAIGRALAQGGRYTHEYRARRRDGAYHWIEANGHIVYEVSGAPVSFPGVIIDIGERRRIAAERDHAQALLTNFVQAMPGVVYAKDRDGRLMIGNLGTSGLIGKAPQEYIGRTDLEVLEDKEQAALVMATDQRIMDSGISEQIEEEVNFPDGRKAIWLSTKSPLRDSNDAVVGLVGTSLDITERKAAEASHREIEERYRLAIDATSDVIWDWRLADGHVIWNDAVSIRFGHAVDQTSATWWLDHIHPDDRPRIDAGIHAVIDNGGSSWTDEYRFERADGSYAFVLDRGTVLRDLAGHPVRMIGAMMDLTERMQSAHALSESEERLRLATEASDTGLWDVDLVENVLIWPARTKAMFGISPDVPVSMEDFYAGLHPDDLDRTSKAFLAAVDAGQRAIYDVEYRTVGKEDGIVRWIAAKGRGVFEDERCVRVVGVALDITTRKADEERLRELNDRLEMRVAEEVAERTKAEDALRQSQKMEAVGQLTGGIAHDFNNMLAVVIGSLDLLTRRLGNDDPRARRYVDAAMDGAHRAAQLAQRLLAFSRQQPLKPEMLDANRLVAGMSDMLRHTLPDILPETILAGGLWRIFADPNQLENGILNLAVNARDAMPGGGRLTIETANCHLDDRYAADHMGVPAGQYVMIAVSDTGSGMSQQVIAKAFDPFFTTKEVGRGTGLGLSQVYGFVKQSGGHVKIYSEIGEGTTVKVYLPRSFGSLDETHEVRDLAELPLGDSQEVILVVEDEPGVRQVSVDALNDLGYRVLEANGAEAALKLIDAHPEISLLFTDVVMPEINGSKLAEEARKRRPALKVLFTTGYTRNAVVHNGVLDPGVHLIGKPFTIEDLAACVRRVLEEESG
ncbi:PAS domain S-box-containing protein [Sphingobium sp. AP50]|uniref:PAS domain-containing hybrid sensor histidine kinase/response regulator n=1 Tax=Sphingobium sp. AP50 TaxID=1884369 RepID=UPI0008C21565|nr:PAS domain-containing protein [Sphingobium sp. AP50]SEK04001.1 PAS domain S-box-containing protein [Sphingobium sp. AP50]